MTDETIKFGSLMRLMKDGWAGVPDSPNPFHFAGNDGLFLHRRGLLGRGIVKLAHFPGNWAKFGNANGSFSWDANPIPKEIMGQVISFFERIYDRQHTEAAVLLAMHKDTKEWRVFIPTQLVAHGGVNYVFDPLHIKMPWILVGSIHSHCDFGAGHSGTDTGDADGFDGFHATIGMIKRDIPQIVAMVSMNKHLFHFKDDSFPSLFDYSEPKKHEAPLWWDRYVEDTKNKVKPVGFELFEKFKKPTEIKAERSVTVIRPAQNAVQPRKMGEYPSDWKWHEKAQRMVHKNWKIAEDGTIEDYNIGAFPNQNRATPPPTIPKNKPSQPIGYDPSDWDDFYRLQGLEGPPEGYEWFSPQQLIEEGYIWDPEEKTWEWRGYTEDIKDKRPMTMQDLRDLGLDGDKDVMWEERIPAAMLDTLFDSDLIQEEDIEKAIRMNHIAGDPVFWQEIFLSKAIRANNVLRSLGLNVYFGISGEPPEDIEMALLPENKPNPMKGAN